MASRNAHRSLASSRGKVHSEPKAFAQTSEGFEHFQQRQGTSGFEPASILIVMEATGSYWVALATTLHQAGFTVSVINPAQAHHFARIPTQAVQA